MYAVTTALITISTNGMAGDMILLACWVFVVFLLLLSMAFCNR